MDILQSIARTAKNILLSQPFYGLFLSTLNKEVNSKIPTMGVGKNGINTQLVVNPEYWEKLPNDNIRQGALLHELGHVAQFHLSLRDKFADKELFNVAADLVVNQTIDAKYKDKSFLDLDSFGNIGLEKGKGTEYYYDRLQKVKNDPNSGKGGDKLRQMCQDLKDGQGQGDTKPGGEGGLANHQSWKEYDKMSETEKKMMDKQTEHQLKNVAEQIKNRGNIPGEMQSILDAILNPEPPKFNWKAYLRRFAGGSQKVYTKKIRRKQSKRFEGNPGLKVKQKKHIMVAIDTSGSVSDEELAEFMGEINHIYKTGVEVTIVQCDTRIPPGGIKKFEGLSKWDGRIVGRGGTSFTPPCEYLNEHKSTFASMIYLTDGEGSTEVKPEKKTLWVHSSRSTINKDLPGLSIKLN